MDVMGENTGEKEQAKEEDDGHLATPFLFAFFFYYECWMLTIPFLIGKISHHLGSRLGKTTSFMNQMNSSTVSIQVLNHEAEGSKPATKIQC